MLAPKAQFMLCERGGRWFVPLRQQLQSTAIRLCQHRTLDLCTEQLTETPGSFVALEGTAQNLLAALRWLAQLESRWPHARAVVLADSNLMTYESAFREAGAALVAYSVTQTAEIVRLARRHLEATLGTEWSPLEPILARLPWSDGP